MVYNAAMAILSAAMLRFEQPLIEAMGAAIALLRSGLEGGTPSKKGESCGAAFGPFTAPLSDLCG